MYKILKIILPIFMAIFLLGCDALANTPTSKVEELLSKYQTLDEDIKDDIDTILNNYELTETQDKRYRKILEDQYRNLVYDIKDEEIDGDKSTIKVEIEVLNHRKVVDEVEDEYANTSTYGNSDYIDYKLDKLEENKEKVTYTINFTCTKDDNGDWKVDNLTNLDIEKIQGMY